MGSAVRSVWRGVLLCVLSGIISAGLAMSPADKELYEKLGLSEIEWAKVLEMKLPLTKVCQLLESGISVSEYNQEPWKRLSITEAEYIRMRRAGHSDAEVRSTFSITGQAADKTRVRSFFLPGAVQMERGHRTLGWLMAGAALGCVSLFVGQSIHSRSVAPLGLCLLVSDMLWSGIDMSVRISAASNMPPFAADAGCAAGGVLACFSFK